MRNRHLLNCTALVLIFTLCTMMFAEPLRAFAEMTSSTQVVGGSSATEPEVTVEDTGISSEITIPVGASTTESAITVPTLDGAAEVPILSGSATSAIMNIFWQPVLNSTVYEVEIDNGVITSTVMTSFMKPCIPNESHTFRVRALFEDSFSAWSEPLTLASESMPVPSIAASSVTVDVNISVSEGDTGIPPAGGEPLPAGTVMHSVDFSWPSNPSIASYVVEVDGVESTSGNSWYHLQDCTPNVPHTFRIKALGGTWSDAVPFTTDDVIGSVANITANATDTSINLTWDSVERANRYNIVVDNNWYWSATSSFSITGLAPSNSHSYKINATLSREEGDSYYYNRSAWSDVAYVTAIMPVLDPSIPIPTNITHSVNYNNLYLTWDEVLNAVSYDIEERDIYGWVIGNFNSTTPSLSNIYIPDGQTVTFQVRARLVGAFGNWSDTITIAPLPASIVPTNFKTTVDVTYTENAINISWDAVPSATTYDVEIDGLTISGVETCSYKHTGLAPSSWHNYRVRVSNGVWSTYRYAQAGVMLYQIQMVDYSLTGTDIYLSWGTQYNATGYNVEVDGQVISVGAATNYVGSIGLTNTTHTYRVQVVNGTQLGPWSNPIVINPPQSLSVPTNLTQSTTSSGITVSWDAVAGASSYDVQVDGVNYANVTTTNCLMGGLVGGVQHPVRVRAVGDTPAYVSDWSNDIYIVPLVELADTLTISNVYASNSTAGKSQVGIKWVAVDLAINYDIEVDGIVHSDIVSTGGYETDNNVCEYRIEVANGNHSIRARSKTADYVSDWCTYEYIDTYNMDMGSVRSSSTRQSITLTWDAVVGADRYTVKLDNGQVIYTDIASYTESNLEPGSSHSYSVRAERGELLGNWCSKNVSTNSNYTTLSGTISVDTTLTKDDGPYIVETDTIIAPNVTVTVEAGTILQLDTGYDMYNTYRDSLTIQGRLLVEGSPTDTVTIVSTSSDKVAGNWDRRYGWQVIKVADGGELSINYANVDSTVIESAGSISITNSNIQNESYMADVPAGQIPSDVHDIAIHGTSATLLNNIITGDVKLNLSNLNQFSKVGNEISRTKLFGNLSTNITMGKGNYIIPKELTLTVESDGILSFQPGSSIEIQTGENYWETAEKSAVVVRGKLDLLGSATESVTLNSLNNTDLWHTLTVTDTGEMNCSYVELLNSNIISNGKFRLTESRVQNDGHPIVSEGTELVLLNNTISDYIHIDVSKLLELSSITDTTTNNSTGSAIKLGGTITVSKSLTEGSYKLFKDLFVAENAELTIEPGTTIKSESDVGVLVQGRLNAVGTVDKPIIFTGTTPDLENTWTGIRSTTSSSITFNNVITQYAGVNLEGVVSIANSAIDTYTVINGTDIFVQNNTLLGKVFLELDNLQVLRSIENNKTIDESNVIMVVSGVLNSNVTLPKANYVTLGFRVSEGAELTLTPGSVFRVLHTSTSYRTTDGTKGTIRIDGKLTAKGTREAPIVFTDNTDAVYFENGDQTGYTNWCGFKIIGEIYTEYMVVNNAHHAFDLTGKLTLLNSEVCNSYRIFNINQGYSLLAKSNIFKATNGKTLEDQREIFVQDSADSGHYEIVTKINKPVDLSFNYWDSANGPSTFDENSGDWVGIGCKANPEVKFDPCYKSDSMAELHKSNLQIFIDMEKIYGNSLWDGVKVAAVGMAELPGDAVDILAVEYTFIADAESPLEAAQRVYFVVQANTVGTPINAAIIDIVAIYTAKSIVDGAVAFIDEPDLNKRAEMTGKAFGEMICYVVLAEGTTKGLQLLATAAEAGKIGPALRLFNSGSKVDGAIVKSTLGIVDDILVDLATLDLRGIAPDICTSVVKVRRVGTNLEFLDESGTVLKVVAEGVANAITRAPKLADDFVIAIRSGEKYGDGYRPVVASVAVDAGESSVVGYGCNRIFQNNPSIVSTALNTTDEYVAFYRRTLSDDYIDELVTLNPERFVGKDVSSIKYEMGKLRYAIQKTKDDAAAEGKCFQDINTEPSYEFGWLVENCAEVWATRDAIMQGAKVENIVLRSVVVVDGSIKLFCGNCQRTFAQFKTAMN